MVSGYAEHVIEAVIKSVCVRSITPNDSRLAIVTANTIHWHIECIQSYTLHSYTPHCAYHTISDSVV